MSWVTVYDIRAENHVGAWSCLVLGAPMLAASLVVACWPMILKPSDKIAIGPLSVFLLVVGLGLLAAGQWTLTGDRKYYAQSARSECAYASGVISAPSDDGAGNIEFYLDGKRIAYSSHSVGLKSALCSVQQNICPGDVGRLCFNDGNILKEEKLVRAR